MYSDIDQDDILIKLTEIKSEFNKYEGIMNSQNVIVQKHRDINEKLNELEESIKSYFGKYFSDINQSYVAYAQEMKVKKSLLVKQQQDFEAKLEINEEYKRLNKIDELEHTKSFNMVGIDKNEIEEKIKNITIDINKFNDEKNYLKNQIELLESSLDGVFDVENRLDELTLKIDEMEKKCHTLEQFSSHYLNNMKHGFIQKLKLISGQDIDASLDVNLNVKINEQGSGKEINFFSTGYKDLIYICMRLSLIDCLFESEKPFVILDDPFVNLDESKIKSAMELLRELGHEYQIIYFVCHESRR